MALGPMRGFDHSKNIDALDCADGPNVDTSHCIVPTKPHGLISPPIPPEKPVSIGKLSSSQMLVQVFQSSILFSKAPIFIIGKKYYNCHS